MEKLVSHGDDSAHLHRVGAAPGLWAIDGHAERGSVICCLDVSNVRDRRGHQPCDGSLADSLHVEFQ